MNSNLYLITGDENFEKSEALRKIKEGFSEELVRGINFITLDKDSIDNLENELSTYALGSSRKFILIKFDKKSKKNDKEEEAQVSNEISKSKDTGWFRENIEELLKESSDNIIVFYGEFQKRDAIYKFIEKNGKIIICDKKKGYELLSWCKKKFDENGAIIQNSNISYLIEVCGNDKLILKNEIDKLTSYSLNGQEINRNIIDSLCIRNSDAIIFSLTNSLGNKDIKSSLKILDELLENKEPIQMITIMIARHFRTLAIAKVALQNNKNVSDELNGKNPVAYSRQAKLFSLDEIIKIIRALAKIDMDSKLGLIDLKIGLENVICM